ncbi:hypothetical protein ZWY2020_029304 [Hordeum vulgare]|nr:hypothetical protein ZWY2020_029304 [Hordeum vulgare]
MLHVDARDKRMLPIEDQEKDMSEQAVVRRARAVLRGYEEWRASRPLSSSRLSTKVVDALMTPGDGEIAGDGLAGIRLCKDSFMPVKYHKCDDGHIIFGKGWSDFVDTKELKIHKAILLGFKTTNREDLQIKVAMNMLTGEPQM